MAARCHGLVLAAQGDLDGAADALDRALKEHDAVRCRSSSRARCLSPARCGAVSSRNGRHASCSHAPPSCSTGSAPQQWGERAREEHARTATRSAPTDLTPTELRIARLAASGLTNDAIAAEVFVSRKTVEANLGRVYRKLGIKTRAQLSRALDAREPQAIP